MVFFFQGLTMGLAYVAPIGLQNLFVINSALVNRRRRAYLTALIVIFFDVSLALACFFGVGAVMQRWEWLRLAILLAGSLVVIGIGVSLLRSRGGGLTPAGESLSLGKTVVSAFVVTWCNPQALIDGTMMLGAFRATLTAAQATAFISGVAVASCLWFTGLTTAVSLLGSRFTPRVIRWINLICGGVIILYGVRLLIGFIVAVTG